MRYLNYIGKVEEFKPSYFAFKNVGVRAVASDTFFKYGRKLYKAIGGFMVSRPVSGTDEYIPAYTQYGIRLDPPDAPGDVMIAKPADAGDLDPDLLRVFKKICIKHHGKDIFLRTNGKNKGRFFYLNTNPMVDVDVGVKVNFNRQRYL